jgi:uncharacterized protein (UPF0548 family)
MFLLRAPSRDRLDAVLAASAGAAFTYDEVGASEPLAGHARPGATLPEGYRHGRWAGVVGEGESDFDRARAALRAWSQHREQGFTVVPDDPPITVGTEVLTVLRVPPVNVLAVCRVVWVVDEADRFGFAYGTLPTHPASGEEAFVVVRTPSGRVEFQVTVFSRAHHPLMRLGGPLARWQQGRAGAGYVDALRRAMGSSGTDASNAAGAAERG